MTEKMQGVLSFLGRLLLSLGLLVLLFTKVNWQDTIRVLKMSDMGLLGWAFLVNCAIQLIALIRWLVFMKVLNLEAPFGIALRYFLIGFFCNLFMPSLSGDLVKAVGLSHGVGQKAKVFASVVLDRLSGFGGLVVIAILAYLFGQKLIDAPAVIIPVAVLTLLSLVIGLMLFHRGAYEVFCRVFRPFPRFHKALMEMHEDVALMKARKRTALGCLLLSCLIQVSNAYMFYLIALALHQKAALIYFLVFSPIVCAIAFLPSFGGLGWREVGWASLLSRVGFDEHVAVGMSLLSFFFLIVFAVLGGIFYVATFSHRRVQCASPDALAVGENT